MSDVTFEQLWKSVMVYFPECPLPLAQQFVNNAYSKALSEAKWTGQRGDSSFVIPEPYTAGLVSVNAGDTVVSAADAGVTLWLSVPDQVAAGFQICIGGRAPFATILSVDSNGDLTLDAPWPGETQIGQTYSIQKIYLTPPTDFASFISVLDLDNNWKLRLNFTVENIDYFDGQRSRSGTPFLLAGGVSFSSSSRPRWELWPRTGTAKVYPFHYFKRLPLLSAPSDRPIFPFRGDILRHGVLAELALWPGTKQLKNPYFDMQQYAIHRQIFEDGLKEIQRDDQELSQTVISYYDNLPFAPFDASWVQTHGGWPFI